jgi:hypothetical protein
VRDTAIRNVYKNVVTIDAGVYAYDKDGNSVEIDDELIEAEMSKIALDVAKKTKLAEIAKVYNEAISALVGNTDQYEMVSWAKQEAEARAYIADNTIATPLLSGMVAARGLGESVADFAKKIIANADEYKIAYASILGSYQARQKAIAVATTVEEVQAIK